MKKMIPFVAAAALLGCVTAFTASAAGDSNPLQKRENLTACLNRSYKELPLGSIRPDGWLKEMLVRQRDGITARLDENYPQVCGERNGWLGGDGDQWERGPYWIDGLLPMAYILDDESLKAKALRWVEWTLASQGEDGQFGPRTVYPNERGIQRSNSLDWWPRMVVLKILQQYYNATGDERVPGFMDRYFRYQLRTLPEKPLGNWTRWAEFRAGDNMLVALWLYGKTGEPYLLELCDLLHSQGWDFTHMFLETDEIAKKGSIHCVNLAQGLKEPLIYWQARPGQRFRDAVDKALEDIREYNGFPCGMFGGDEALHGNNPVQGSELCSAVELMYSLEEMQKITGSLEYAELLERVAFNALPAQTTDDFTCHQYFQQANQISLSLGPHNFDTAHSGTANVMGVLSGYPCCLCNLHQGWPKFVQNLWYRDMDGGFAALAYAPCHFSAEADGVQVEFREKTYYPMDGAVRVDISMPGRKKASFALNFRIPSWAEGADVRVNGVSLNGVIPGHMCRIERKWRDGDSVELDFPMTVRTDRWYENAVSIERGPLVYALKIEEQWDKVELGLGGIHGDWCWEVKAASPWNYAFLVRQVDSPDASFTVSVDEEKLKSDWYWSPDASPLSLSADAAEVTDWKEYNGDCGPLPYSARKSVIYNRSTSHVSGGVMHPVTLIPYGCTTLRISEFPVLSR